MPNGISIFDVIKRGGYEASLITTFNATLPFYEEVVLRKLVGAGCRHNVVLMDQRQCAAAWDSEASRPRLAGYGYTLLPIGVSGAFHPKVCILVGPKKAAILIGSHNLTLSGFGYNREISNWIDINGAKDTEGASILRAVWGMVREWIELERGSVPEQLLESALAIASFVGPLIANAEEVASTIALAQTPRGSSLFNQLVDCISFTPKRIAVIGAFFDQDQVFISNLKAQWPSAQIVVGIDPDTVQHPGTPVNDAAKYVDARQVWTGKGGYLHAKAIYMESDNALNDAFVCGSANPSRPAWMADSSGGNVEAVLLRIGQDSRAIAEETAIRSLFDLPPITSDIFASIATRSKACAEIEQSNALPILSGVSDPDLGLLHISNRIKLLNLMSAILYGPNLELLETIRTIEASGGCLVLKPTVDISSIRSCVLESDGASVARVMVVHPSVLASSARSSKQYQIRSALGALGSSEADISKVIVAVEKVIFADETAREVEAAVRDHQEHRVRGNLTTVPESLAISVNDMPRAKKKVRLLKSGDLAYLIDVLLRRLSEGLETQAVDTDKAGRTEEEQVGKEDTELPEVESRAEATTTLSDQQIAEVVARRARKLTRRMVCQLEQASKDQSRKASAVIQLIAVLALVRELRHLDKQKRWRSTGCELIDGQDRRHLLDGSVKYLFGGKAPLIDALDMVADESSEEAIQLRILLAWLAWDLGDEITEQIRRIYDAAELKAKLKANALFLKLMPTIASDESAVVELRESITRTIKPSPAASMRAMEWIKFHYEFGESCSKGLVGTPELKVGGYCQLLGRPGNPHVIMEIDADVIGFWDFDCVRQYKKDKVSGVCLNKHDRQAI